MFSENVQLALIVAVPGLLAPLLMAALQNKNLRKIKEADYKRQDLVASNLLERQDAIAEKAAETAMLLRKNTAAVAAAAAETHGQLKVIHALVNSNMTTVMQSELAAYRASLVLMNEVIDLKHSAGIKPGDFTVQAMGVIKEKIATLESALAERDKQTSEPT